MQEKLTKILSWLAGIAALVVIIWYFKPEGFGRTLGAIGLSGIGMWMSLTLIARLIMAETTFLPLTVLGFGMSRADLFWISWIRTLANQVLPLSGLAAYAKIIRSRTDISWSELAALATPQIVLAIAALGVVGLGATLGNLDSLEVIAATLLVLYAGVVIVAVAIASGAAWFIESLPQALSSRAAQTADALRQLATHRHLLPKIVALHVIAILLRGGRLWILFAAAGVQLDWQGILLVLAIAESAALMNITPGGLGIREAFVMGGSALLGIPAPIAASVALVDRLFVVAITALLAAPAVAILRRSG